MARRWGKFALLMAALLALSAQAQGQPPPKPNLSVTASASTPKSFPFPITVYVTVVNYGSTASQEATVQLFMKPVVSPGTRPQTDYQNIWDPVTLEQDLPALQSGEKKTLVFETFYAASSHLIDQRGCFTANNLGPTLLTQTRVNFSVTLK